jgi:hypothetical protein
MMKNQIVKMVAGSAAWLVLICFSSCPLHAQSSENYVLHRSVIAQGGQPSSSNNYSVLDAIGQPVPSGEQSSDQYSVWSGFIGEDMTGTAVAGDSEARIPETYSLEQNYPNPFNHATTIEYRLPEGGTVDIRIYDLKGSEIIILQSDTMPAGSHRIKWEGSDRHGRLVPSGLYICRGRLGNRWFSRKITLLR